MRTDEGVELRGYGRELLAGGGGTVRPGKGESGSKGEVGEKEREDAV